MMRRSSLSRRDFLTTTSGAAAGMVLSARALHAMSERAPRPFVMGMGQTGNVLLPEPIAGTDLHALAAAALDAAKAAGASYADIRVAEQHELEVRQMGPSTSLLPDVRINVWFDYGVRALVDGAWAFAGGVVPEPASIAASARQAVSAAKLTAKLGRSTSRDFEFTPAPITKGSWTSPIVIDPFSVPIEDQMALIWATIQSGRRYPGTDAWTGWQWKRETRAIASTDGMQLTQTLHKAYPYCGVRADRGMHTVSLSLPIGWVTGGYETMLRPDLQEMMDSTAQDALRLAHLPKRTMDVGRYPAVLDGRTVGAFASRTLGQALELDRVLGEEADASGTSFLAPVNEVLGAQLFSPQLSITADRAVPASVAVKWDDEGVESHAFPVIEQGRVVDYFTSRTTAGALRDWYQQRGMPVTSRGCTLAPRAGQPVVVRQPQMTIAHNPSETSLDDLCRDISRGVVLRQGWGGDVRTDHQCATGMVDSTMMFEIERGRVVRCVQGNMIQFDTRSLWKSMDALGGASTREPNGDMLWKGMPWGESMNGITAPAARFSRLDLILPKMS